jgi:prepilin-type N-terminal cleavage/methylation domain-containing protein
MRDSMLQAPAHIRSATRRGATLVELMITMLIVGIVGAAFMRIMVYQSRFFDRQATTREARSVSRGALNLLLSELRMVAVPGGVLVATNSDVVARVPYAWGVVCASTAAATTISLLPTDSLTFVEPGGTGYAWRDSTGNYTYQSASFTLAPGLTSDCAATSIATMPGGRAVTVTPVVHASAKSGTPVFLYRRIRYHFRSSTSLPGRIALWRTNEVTSSSEELMAPFDSTAAFHFYVDGLVASQATPPALIANLRGLELRLHGQSEHAARTTKAPQTSVTQTAVFFMNRAP